MDTLPPAFLRKIGHPVDPPRLTHLTAPPLPPPSFSIPTNSAPAQLRCRFWDHLQLITRKHQMTEWLPSVALAAAKVRQMPKADDF